MVALADLRLQSQQRCDRVNSTTITTDEWNAMVNSSIQELYAAVLSVNEDYNATTYVFTLAGGDPPNNLITVGPGTTVPNFLRARGVWRQLTGAPTTRWAPLSRLGNLIERNMYVGPTVSLLFGQIPSAWNLYGNQLEVLPPQASGGTYQLLYVPTMPPLVADQDTIDQYWLSMLGWHEFVIWDVAMKALLKEESLDTAGVCAGQATKVKQRVLLEATPRDDSEPGKIADVKTVRSNYGLGGWGGWGGDGGGGW